VQRTKDDHAHQTHVSCKHTRAGKHRVCKGLYFSGCTVQSNKPKATNSFGKYYVTHSCTSTDKWQWRAVRM
jgi:hypothetical protein